MGVDLGGGETFVTKEFLDHAQVGAAFDKVRGVSVTKCVGMNVTTRDTMIENAANVARTETVCPSIQEERVRR